MDEVGFARLDEKFKAAQKDLEEIVASTKRLEHFRTACIVVGGVLAATGIGLAFWVQSASKAASDAKAVITLAQEQVVSGAKRDLDAYVKDVRGLSVVPIGGIIPWYRRDQEPYPPGYELCDGGRPATGSVFTGNKPDLIGYFLRGAELPSDKAQGAAEVDLPDHAHDIAHTHSVGALFAAMGPEAPNMTSNKLVNPATLGAALRGNFKSQRWGRNLGPDGGSFDGYPYSGAAIMGELGAAEPSKTGLPVAAKIKTLPPSKDVVFLIRVR